MATRQSCIVAVALCGLLAFATSASADCAWVLWIRVDDGAGQSHWSIYGSFPSNKVSLSDKTIQLDTGWSVCTGERDRVLKEMGSQENNQKMLQARTKGYFALCLPDTVDPRGPKGK